MNNNDKQKTAAKQEQKDMLNALYSKYGLGVADTFTHKHFVLITRTGMEKIVAKSGIGYDMELVSGGSDYAIIKGNFNYQERTVVTFASANESSSTSAYYAEMAEKRCLSRGVLKILGLYELGFFGDDEFDTKTMSAKDQEEYRNNKRVVYGGGSRVQKKS